MDDIAKSELNSASDMASTCQHPGNCRSDHPGSCDRAELPLKDRGEAMDYDDSNFWNVLNQMKYDEMMKSV